MSDSIEMPLHTATWRGVLPIYKKVIQDNKGNSMVDNMAHHELNRMAGAADMFGKFTRALQEVEDVLLNAQKNFMATNTKPTSRQRRSLAMFSMKQGKLQRRINIHEQAPQPKRLGYCGEHSIH